MPNGAGRDFELAKYESDRDHEIKLNEFTHALEVEQLKLLIFLNGGAAAALLTFAEKAPASANRGAFLGAIGCWLAGLVVGAVATFTMRTAQSLFGKAYRHRRNAVEWRRLTGSQEKRERLIGPAEAELVQRLDPPPDADATGDILYDRTATLIIADARAANRRIFPLSVISILLFLAGAVSAAFLVIAVPAGGGDETPSANVASHAQD